ncbi:MAG: DUF1592 domain-containing protein [Pirellulales bacterium]
MRFVGLMIASVALAAKASLAAAGDFQADVVGFLSQHCLDCHAGPEAEMGLDLARYPSEAEILGDRIRWRAILARVAAGEMPPPEEADPPPATESAAFLATVRAAFARADAATPPDPGPSVLRRLNRAEYDLTIRDLFATDFQAAATFPADGVGYGFGNIADVLTVSPLLMERYLAAAEDVAAGVLPAESPRPVVMQMVGKYCEPASPHVPQGRFRPIRADADEPILAGPLNTPASIEPDGEYVVRARLYATSADGRPVKVALMVTGPEMPVQVPPAQRAALDLNWVDRLAPRAILAIHEITAREPAEAQTIEGPLVRMAGVERIMLGALKPEGGGPPPTLHVEWLGYEGPRDARGAATKAFLKADPALPAAVQARENLSRLAQRAWRRPVEPAAIDRLVGLLDDAVAAGESHEHGLRRAIAAVLASPEFVFRMETPPPATSTGAVPVSDIELASRLSYFLWSSCPDEELLELAARGELAANLPAQVRRMLADPRAAALVDQFAMQWLGLGRLAVHGADTTQFERWRPQLAASMLEETRRYVADVFRSGGSLLVLLDSDFTWVDGDLAMLYGLTPQPPLGKGEWRRVTFDSGERGGLLGQASVLTVTSNPARTSPVKRGKWVLEQLLGAPPPMAPPDVPSIDDAERQQLTGTLRQRMEQHRADPRCAGCHRRMDAFGFALEEFDPIGQWRQKDGAGQPIDADSDVGGHTISGLTGLKRYVLERREEFLHCLASKLLIYALGRGLEPGDEPALAAIERAVENDGYRFSSLVHAVTESVPFRLRRSAAQETAATSGARP